MSVIIKNNYHVIAMLMTKNENYLRVGDDLWKPKHDLSMIEQYLFDIQHYVDGVVVVYNKKSNDGKYQKSDGTLEILQTAKVVKKIHINPMDQLNFDGSRDRQILFDMAKEFDPEFFFTIDADEIACDQIVNWLPHAFNDRNTNLWYFKEINLWRSRIKYRTDKWNNSWFPRLFRNVPGIKSWKDDPSKSGIHEHRVPYHIPGQVGRCQEVGILHFAWVNWKDRVEKTERYIRHEMVIRKASYEEVAALYVNDTDETGLQLGDVSKEWKFYEYDGL